MAARVLVVGEALVDVRIDERDGAGPDPRSEHTGGSPLNVAVALARLGVSTTLAAQVGDDAHGRQIEAHLEASGVDLVRLSPTRRTSTATARIGVDGGAGYEFDLTWDPSELPGPKGFDAVHVGSIGAALAPGADAVASLVFSATAAGVPVSLDPNVRPQITPRLGDVRLRIEVLEACATVIKLSDEDAALLRPGLPLDRVVTDLAGAGRTQLAVLTKGSGGLLLSNGGGPVLVPAPQTRVVDTIGAGDTVTAALLAGLLSRGLPVPDGAISDADAVAVAQLAVGAAAVTCARPGADPPWRHELRGFDPNGMDAHP